MSRVARMNESCYKYKWPMSHIWMSRVTRMNESRRAYEWVMSPIRMSRVTHMNESCHTCEWVMSHMWMSHVTHVNESCHAYGRRMACDTYEWVMSHIWTRHVTHINESCHTYQCVISPTETSNATRIETHTNPQTRTAEAIRHTRQGHTPHMNESRTSHERGVSHISHDINMKETCHRSSDTHTYSDTHTPEKGEPIRHRRQGSTLHMSPPPEYSPHKTPSTYRSTPWRYAWPS